MPRTETTTRTLFKFEELSDEAKRKARDWFREASAQDEFWDATYEDAVQCAAILGIEIADRPRNNPKAMAEPAIWFSGFWSQGDGACFEGSYSWKACSHAIRDHAPKDETLHAIADTLTAQPHGEGWRAGMKHRGHYYHSGCMSVDVEFDDEWYRSIDAGQEEPSDLPQAEFTAGEEIITQAMRDFADWIYRQLEAEWDYRNSDECVDENIEANEYEFTEDGERA